METKTKIILIIVLILVIVGISIGAYFMIKSTDGGDPGGGSGGDPGGGSGGDPGGGSGEDSGGDSGGGSGGGSGGVNKYRYVRVIRDGNITNGTDGTVTLTELEVYSGGVNVALNKTGITKSSSYDEVNGTNNFPDTNLTDGVTTGFNAMSTNNSARFIEWVLLDLEQEYDIDRIVMYNRVDNADTWNRFENISIELSKTSTMEDVLKMEPLTLAQGNNATVEWDVKN